MSADTAEATASTRNYVHVDFDQMTCPVEGCESGKGKTPQTGSVPGIKRHVRMIHGEEVFAKQTWPALRSAEGPMGKATKDQLFLAAKSRGLVDADATAAKYTKEALMGALVSGQTLAKAKPAEKAPKAAKETKAAKPAAKQSVTEPVAEPVAADNEPTSEDLDALLST